MFLPVPGRNELEVIIDLWLCDSNLGWSLVDEESEPVSMIMGTIGKEHTDKPLWDLGLEVSMVAGM